MIPYFVKAKKPITQSITNRREHSSHFKAMFYVIGFVIQSTVKNPCQHGTNYISKKILSNLGRIFKIHFLPSWLEAYFCPIWTEVKTPTSTQVVSKSKIISTQLAEKSDCNFCTGCVEVEFAPKQKARH